MQTISSITNPPCPPDNAGCGIWRINPLPATGVNPTNGAAIVHLGRWALRARPLIYYSRSTDNGATWSAAAQLAPPGVANTYQVEPWVASDEIGTLHAVWYDDRENPNTSIFNIYYSQSTDDGATWSTAQRISTATSDLRIGIPSSYALAAGDYINVTAANGNVYAVWTDTRQGSGEDIYVVRGTYNQGTPTPTVTGTPPTATPTRTATATTTRTSTPPPTIPATTTNTATATWTPTTYQHADRHRTARQHRHARGDRRRRRSARSSSPTCRRATRSTPTSAAWPAAASSAATPPARPAPPATPCFNGGANVTRGQVAKIVANAAGFSDAIPSTQQTFTDVPYSNPFWLYIERLAEPGTAYISGYSTSPPCPAGQAPCFLPGNHVTRGQMAKIDANAAGYTDADPLDAADVHRCALWQPVLALRRAGQPARRDQRLLDQPAVSGRRRRASCRATT